MGIFDGEERASATSRHCSLSPKTPRHFGKCHSFTSLSVVRCRRCHSWVIRQHLQRVLPRMRRWRRKERKYRTEITRDEMKLRHTQENAGGFESLASLVSTRSVLFSPATIDICSRWEANTDYTNTVDTLLPPPPTPPRTPITVIVGSHGREASRRIFTCARTPSINHKLTCSTCYRLHLIYSVVGKPAALLTQVPACDRSEPRSSEQKPE